VHDEFQTPVRVLRGVIAQHRNLALTATNLNFTHTWYDCGRMGFNTENIGKQLKV
jgi:hypothetical protein